jgi:hypothetical protein
MRRFDADQAIAEYELGDCFDCYLTTLRTWRLGSYISSGRAQRPPLPLASMVLLPSPYWVQSDSWVWPLHSSWYRSRCRSWSR